MTKNEFTELQSEKLNGLLFEVRTANRHYKIYGDGRAEGFGDGQPIYIDNHFYAIARTLLMAQRRSLLAEFSPTNSLVDSADGLPQGEAL